jgi:UMF1 family MFS transporter
MDTNSHQRTIRAWTMYDWANSVFATSIMAAILPVYYASVAVQSDQANTATVYWSITTSIGLLLVAFLGPILGAMADFLGAKKRMLIIFVFIGVTGTALLYLVGTGDWFIASLFFIVGMWRARTRSTRCLRAAMPWATWAEGFCWRSTWP